MVRRVPAVYLIYAGLVLLEFVVQPLLFLATSQPLHPSWGGLAFVALVLVGIARRSWLAWVCLLLWTLVLTVLVLPWAFSSVNAMVLVAYDAATLALLLSRPMRAHVRGPSMRRGSLQSR
jgi:hypothetical protein